MTNADSFGPQPRESGVTFRLWAPGAKKAELIAEDAIPMAQDDGWFSAHSPRSKPGTRYQFRIDGDLTIADPASRFQPQDVAGPSEVIDHAYDWKCANWRGRPWHETTFLELHVGAFTPQGTFRAAIDRLDHLADAGITAIELMPLADFPGRWNWGYDGVLPFAPDSSYGRPEDLKALIDAAHQRGLMVFLDVVYNHFGPEGNYLPRIAPQFFSDAQTPWGSAIDYAVPQVRDFAIENAVAWVRDYRFDGLRLDAVHAIVSPGAPHLLEDLSKAVGAYAKESGRSIHLVLENDDNRASLLAPQEDPPDGHYRAQWNDDYHHAWHVQLTGEKSGYYKDYSNSVAHIARVMSEGFAYQGEPSPHRKGTKRGEPSKHLSPLAFVNFLQNHDQIGNRALGERLTQLAPAAAVEAALLLLLLLPSPPLLFMGDEWGSRQPFPFFCDFHGELADAVRNGRKAEFAEAYADLNVEVPDPLAASTFNSAKLDWESSRHDGGAKRLAMTSALLRARRQHIVPLLPDILPERTTVHFERGLLQAKWLTSNKALHVLANFTDSALPSLNPADTVVWDERRPADAPPWSVRISIGTA